MTLPEILFTPHGFMATGAGAGLLGELLAQLDFANKQAGFDLSETCNPGIGRQQIVDTWAPHGLTPPDEVITWWGWHNGFRKDIGSRSGIQQLPLDFSEDKYRTMPLARAEYAWYPEWVPLWGQGPAHISMSFADDATGTPLIRATDGALGTQPEETDQQVVSLCTPVTWWLIGIEKGWTRAENVSDGGRFWVADWMSIPREWRATQMATI